MNYTLIGMPASGKSTLGVLLAKKLAYDFIDSDIIIQNTTGKKLSTLIDELGPAGFRELENKINCTISPDNSIISTGGSAVYGVDAMEHFRSIGEVIYLKTSYEFIASRIPDLDERGVVHEDGQTLRDIYDERTKLYEKNATITIDLDNKTIDDCIDLIYKQISPGEE